MSRFIAVVHRWHVRSLGFSLHELASTDREIANGEAAIISKSAEGACCSSDYLLIEIGDGEVVLPRQLSFIERITGRIKS